MPLLFTINVPIDHEESPFLLNRVDWSRRLALLRDFPTGRSLEEALHGLHFDWGWAKPEGGVCFRKIAPAW